MSYYNYNNYNLADAVWWDQIGNSLKLLSQIADVQRDRRSAVLRVPREIPWRDYFESQIDKRRESFSVDRMFQRAAYSPEFEPGYYILNKFCPPKIQADYWPGISVPEYLGGRDDLELCDYDIWISGIHTEFLLLKWIEFVTLYTAAARQKGFYRHAAFILEYDGPELSCNPAAGLSAPPECVPERIDYPIEDYDCRVFCLEFVSGQSDIDPIWRGYLAEVAASIGGNNPEFCAALLNSGDHLLHDPVNAAKNLNFDPDLQETGIFSSVWRAMIIQLFPLLERCRFALISKYQNEINQYLPSVNANGERIEEPFDLELSSLYFLITHAAFSVLPSELDAIRVCRKIRNALAHNRLAEFDDIKLLLSLKI